MPEKVDILNIKIDNVNMEQARNKVDTYLKNFSGISRVIVTPNSEMIYRAQDDPEFEKILNNADLSVPDGAGVILASHILKCPLKERVAGFDLMQELFKLAAKSKYSIYLLGGRPGIVDVANDKLIKEYPELNISGIHHGYLDKKLERKVIDEIKELKPDLLFVGMGVPLQERFLERNLEELGVKVAMTVGGSFDVLAEEVKRAPVWMQKAYLEWFYRLLSEPSRLGRMMALPKFISLVFLRAIKDFIY